MKGVTEDPHAFTKSFVISIHTPMKGVTMEDRWLSIVLADFNPHSHEGSDKIQLLTAKSLYISIHTPMKGVTSVFSWSLLEVQISIHTPMKGVTMLQPVPFIPWVISIHTPMKGVTISFSDYMNGIKFQSTLPWREWPYKNMSWFLHFDFNPHSHEGSDRYGGVNMIPTGISIHTPMKGVTLRNDMIVVKYKFQSTLPWREWPCESEWLDTIILISIHTPMKGVTLLLCQQT